MHNKKHPLGCSLGYIFNFSVLNGNMKVKTVSVTNLHEKILNPESAFNVHYRSGIVEVESIMRLPAGTYKQGELLGTVKPAPLVTVRMNCSTKSDVVYTINIYAKTGSIQFNNTLVEITSDLFFIGQAAYVTNE